MIAFISHLAVPNSQEW